MIRYIGKVQIRKWLLPELKLIVKANSYKVNSSVNVDVQREQNGLLYSTFWQFASDDSLRFASGRIRVEKVEEILLSITGLEVYNNTSTVGVHAPAFDRTKKIITSQQDVIEIASTFKQVFEEVYLPGFERFYNPKKYIGFLG
jgi:hypothetical protein